MNVTYATRKAVSFRSMLLRLAHIAYVRFHLIVGLVNMLVSYEEGSEVQTHADKSMSDKEYDVGLISP